jgi:hypothetical protein
LPATKGDIHLVASDCPVQADQFFGGYRLHAYDAEVERRRYETLSIVEIDLTGA